MLDLPSSKFDFGGGIDVQRLVTAPRACSMHSIRTPAPPVGDRRCVARTARRTTRDRDARPETFSRESRAEKLEESPEGRIDCVRCEVVPPPKPAQRARTTGGLVRRRVSALHTAPDRGEAAHPHSRTLQQLCLWGLLSLVGLKITSQKSSTIFEKKQPLGANFVVFWCFNHDVMWIAKPRP